MTKPFNLIMSRKTWDIDRQLNLLTAMAKVVEEDIKIPPQWIAELNDLNERGK